MSNEKTYKGLTAQHVGRLSPAFRPRSASRLKVKQLSHFATPA